MQKSNVTVSYEWHKKTRKKTRNEVPGVFEKADKADGFIEITSLKPGHRTSISAECCEECRVLVIGYQEHTYKQFDFIVNPAKLLTPEIASDKIIMLNCYKSTEENVKKLANPPSFL